MVGNISTGWSRVAKQLFLFPFFFFFPVTVVVEDSSFSPAYVAADLGDQVLFKWNLAASHTEQIVSTSNMTFPCIPTDPFSKAPFFLSPNQTSGKFLLNISASNYFVRGRQYLFSGDASSCQNQNMYGSIIVGTFPYDCGSRQTMTDCSNAVNTTTVNGACVWCGGEPCSCSAISLLTFVFFEVSSTDGFCYAPVWSGTSNCPCDQQPCFADYGCPRGTSAVFCSSVCYDKRTGKQCPPFHGNK